MKTLHALVSVLLYCVLTVPHLSHAESLITESEYRIYEGMLEPLSSTVTDPESPEFLIVQPEITKELSSPISIQFMVIASDSANINWETFKLSYGSLRFDITDRFLRLAKKTKNGYKVDGLEIPEGNHRIQLSIRDSKNRWGAREFVLHVSKAVHQ
jgi:hypothetical protein